MQQRGGAAVRPAPGGARPQSDRADGPPGRSLPGLLGPAAGDRVAGRFRLQRVLARGGSGPVWLALDEVLSRQVALKGLHRPAGAGVGDAITEARAAAAVRHRHVVDVHDVVVDAGGRGWIVMEVLDGPSLAEVIAADGGLPPPFVGVLAAALLDALAALHAAGVVHRDVKPGNVQCCRDGRLVLTDLGVALRVGVAPAEPAVIAGTLPYLAPEVVTEGRSSPSSDLYALGATVFCALEGRPPYRIDCVQDLLEHAAAPPPLPLMPHAGPLAPLVRGLLQPRPQERWDVGAARSHLSALDLGQPPAGRRTRARSSARSAVRT